MKSDHSSTATRRCTYHKHMEVLVFFLQVPQASFLKVTNFFSRILVLQQELTSVIKSKLREGF